jgi:hypothetical protein
VILIIFGVSRRSISYLKIVVIISFLLEGTFHFAIKVDRLVLLSFEVLQFKLIELPKNVSTCTIDLINEDVKVSCEPSLTG